jgi:hypothetical protein
VLYGLRKATANGNGFYAHKTGFTRDSLQKALNKAQFRAVNVNAFPERYALEAVAVRP